MTVVFDIDFEDLKRKPEIIKFLQRFGAEFVK